MLCCVLQALGSGLIKRCWTIQTGLRTSQKTATEKSTQGMGLGRQDADGTTGHTSVKHSKVR